MADTWLNTWGTYYARTNTGTPHPQGDIAGEVSVYLVSQDFSANTSRIRIDHKYEYVKGSSQSITFWGSSNNKSSYRANQGSAGGSYQSKSFNNNYENSSVTRLIGTTYHTVTHGSDGKGTLYVNGSINFNAYLNYPSSPAVAINNITRSSTLNPITLPTIPRATTISTFDLSALSFTEIKVDWATAHNVSKVEYQIGSGAWTNGETSIDKKSGSFVISGLNGGQTYSIKIRVTRKDSGVTTTSNAKSQMTVNIARFVDLQNNIDIDISPEIEIVRNGATTVEIGIFDGETAVYPYTEFTGTTKILTLTASNFYNVMPLSSKTFQFRLKTDDTYIEALNRTFVITSAKPTFENFVYEDINPVTRALTNDLGQSIIKGYSNVKITVLEASKAIGNKGATVLNYQAVIGSKQATAPYQASGDVDITINAVENNTFLVYAIDSRNLSTVVQKSPLSYFNYFKPVIATYSVLRENYISEKTILNITGGYFNADFGKVENEINLEIYYRLVGDETWLLCDNIVSNRLTYNNDYWEVETEIAGDLGASGFTVANSYQVKIVANDELNSAEVITVLQQGVPNIAIHKDGVAVNALYDTDLGGALQVTGDIYQNGLPLSGGGIELVELWSGSWSGGTITLSDDITNYAYCYVVWDGQGTFGIVPVLPQYLTHNPANDIGYFRGGGHTVTSTTQHLSSISATFDYTVKPTKLTWVDSYRLPHTPSSNHSAKIPQTVIRIVGVKLDGDADSGTDFTGIKADLFYENGDGIMMSEETQRYTVSGFTSSNAQHIHFSIRTDKNMKYVTSVELASLKANIRSDKGYVGTGAYVIGGYDFFNDNDFTFVVEKIDNWNISVLMMSANTLNATNNTPCVLGFGEISFTTD